LNNIKVAEISATVPVNTVLSGFLATPGIGTGIYDREDVVLGQQYTRTYTITRTKGGSKPARYNVTWVANDGTFSSAATVDLPLNKPVSFPVTVSPQSIGAHAAIMNLDDPSVAGIEYQTMNVVIVSDQFTAANDYSVTKTGTIGQAQQAHFFYEVPAATPALKVDFSGPSATPGTGQARFLRWHPYGVGIDSNASTSCFSPSAGSCAGSPLSRTTTNPLEGVWELTVDSRRTSDADPTPYSLVASILGATVSPNPDTIASATVGVPVARSYTFTNILGAFTGRGVGTTLGSALIATPSIANLAQNIKFDNGDGRFDIAARHDREPQRSGRPTSTCSSTTARRALACWPGKAPTAIRRNRSRSPIPLLERGACWSTASRSRREPRPTTTSTSS
jgi:hypothetical protein